MTSPRPGSASLRWQVTLIALALVLGFGGGAVAQAKYDALNADKVDGRHAVGAGASVQQRKGKLVATNPTTGRLPNGIVAKAPNSDRLGGYTHQQMSALPLLVQGAGTSGNALATASGVVLRGTGSGGMRFGFVVPPDHDPSRPLLADIVYETGGAAACTWAVQTSGLEGPDNPTGDDIHNGAWDIPGGGFSGDLAVPEGATRAFKATFEWPFVDEPGQFVQFALDRNGDAAGDTCGDVVVYAAQIRY